jgi:hypothetical protein
MKSFPPIFFVLWSLLTASLLPAQISATASEQASEAVYQIFVGKLQPGESLSRFAELTKFGFLRTYSLAEAPKVQGPSRFEAEFPVFVGPYVGKETADQVLIQLRELGYNMAYIEQSSASMTDPDGEPLMYSVQLGAFSELNMTGFEKIANIPAHGVSVLYENGLYKVLCGMYTRTQVAYIKDEVIPYFANSWGMNGFLKAFRQDGF